MTVLTFPSNPTLGQRYNAPNEIQYVFDGVKWIVETTTSTSEAVTNSTQDRVAPMFVDGDNTGITFTYNAATNTMSAEVTAVNGDTLVNGDHEFKLESDGTLTLDGDPFNTFTTGTVNLHNGGNQSAQILQFDDGTRQSVITGPTPDAGNSAQRLIIQGQRATGQGEGGDVYVWGGDADRDGGDIKIYAGDADNTSGQGYGGYVNIAAGRGMTEGGDVTITAGDTTQQGGTHGNIRLRTNAGEWSFDWTGALTLPPNGDIRDSNGSSVLGGLTDRLVNGDSDVVLSSNGRLTLPSDGEVVQANVRTKSTGIVPVLAGTTGVIFSAYTWHAGMKLVIKVEGRLDGDESGTDHTQMAEAIVAWSYNTAAEPVMSVYGVVHTSPTPLTTFTVRRTGQNGSGLIEVLAQNTQTIQNLQVSVHAAQFVSTFD